VVVLRLAWLDETRFAAVGERPFAQGD